MGRMKEAIVEREAATPKKGGFADVLRRQWAKIEAVAPKHMNTERLFNMTVSAVNRNPKLLEADRVTLLSCLMRCSALGLEPSDVDGLGRAYILPFYNNKRKITEATFILGYKGMLDLARRSGEIKDIYARAVYEGDDFSFELGLDEKLRHVPLAKEKDPSKLTYVYLVAHFVNGGHHIEIMSKDDVEAVRKRSRAKDSGPWVTDYEAMAKKTVMRRAWPWLPLSTEAQGAINYEETTGGYEIELEAPVNEHEAVEAEIVEEKREAPIAEPEVVEVVAPGEAVAGLGHSGSAVCRSCGNVRDDITPDATIEDLNQFLCCEKPDYQWQR